MSHLGLSGLLDAFGIEEQQDYYRLPPGTQSLFVSRLYSELEHHARQGLDAIRAASGVKLHFVVESDEERGLSNLPDDVFFRKICFYANKTLVTFPFHETRRSPYRTVRRGDVRTPRRDKEIIAFAKYRAGRDGYGGKIEEVRRGHHLLLPEFDAFLHLLCTTRPFLDSGDLVIAPSYRSQAGRASFRAREGLGLIPANFQLPELRSQFEEEGLEDSGPQIPYLYLPYFTNLTSEEVLGLRQEERKTYEDFQNHLSHLLHGLPQLDCEKALLEYLREMDDSIQKVVIHHEALRQKSWQQLLLSGAGLVVKGLAVALTPTASAMARLGFPVLTSLKDLKYVGLAPAGSHEHDEVYLMGRLARGLSNQGRTRSHQVAVPARVVIPEARFVRVFYGTDCTPTGSLEPKKFFGIEPNGGGELSFGSGVVCLPKDRDLTRLVKVDPLGEAAFFLEMKDALDKVSSPEVLVFIHGFNVGFAEAAERTAQMAADLDFPGVPVVYSWPSRRKISRYTADEATMTGSAVLFAKFLDRLLDQSGAAVIHLIAHSMGNRALTHALTTLRTEDHPEKSKLRQVVFAAPDVDRRAFVIQAPGFQGKAERFTLYGSSKDLALRISKAFHHYPRAGEAGKAMTLVQGVDSIDATKAETDLLGHSYYCRPSILEDLSELVGEGTDPAHRDGLIPNRKSPYWIYDPEKARSTAPDQEGATLTT